LEDIKFTEKLTVRVESVPHPSLAGADVLSEIYCKVEVST